MNPLGKGAGSREQGAGSRGIEISVL